MKIFGPLYEKVMQWSRHRHAEKYLAGVSIIESSFFPIPTAVMFAPMVMANRERGWWLAFMTTMTSVIGGALGYAIGYFLFNQIGEPIIEFYNAQEKFQHIQEIFKEYGLIFVGLAGATIIPYKVATIASGVMSVAFFPFILVSILGRGLQFYLIAAILIYGGKAIEPHLERWMEIIGWALIIVVVTAFLVYKL